MHQLNISYSEGRLKVRAELLRKGAGRHLRQPHTMQLDEWPPNYAEVLAWRQRQLAKFEQDPDLVLPAKKFYHDNPAAFINHWCDTYDPRNASQEKPVVLPLILFDKQAELVEFIHACLNAEENGLVEKSRDMGASWVCIAFTVWLFLFWEQVAIGWGSRKREQVDRLGDQSSLFEKIRMLLRTVPDVFKPRGFGEHDLTYMRCLNPGNGSTITGEIGDDIGRGGRSLIYFVDEAAYLEHPEKVEAALMGNTRVRIDVSSVSGVGTLFQRKREAGVDWNRGQPIIKARTNIFVLDWSDHPLKTQQWHDERKKKELDQGLGHIFAREVDRDYAAAVEGVIIPADWVNAAIDADWKLGFSDLETGKPVAGLDVADSGVDRNALALRKGCKLLYLEEWGERDTGRTARRAVAALASYVPVELQYDAIGIGAGIKAETNRLRDDGLLPVGLTLQPWVAGAAVIDPFGRVVSGDKFSPLNRDFYSNIKAQAWWNLRRRFEVTFRAINEPGFTYDHDDLIVIPATLPLLRKLQKELSQAIASQSSSLKLSVDKQPDGALSPNLADAMVMAYFPANRPQPRPSLAPPILIRAS
jgi:hypothetical protein